MQKKILITLAMSGVATLPALADVELRQFMLGDVSDNGWSPTGMVKPDFNGTGISCGVGVGDVVKTISLPQGTYTFSFTGLVNAKVVIDGNEVTAKDGNIDYQLVLAAGKEVEVKVSAVTAGVYSFESFSLVLNFDVLEVYNALDKDMKLIEYSVINNLGNNVLQEEVSELIEREYALRMRQGDILEMIANIAISDSDSASYFGNLKYYSEYRLYDTPNTVAEQLTALAADVKAFNDDVAAINQKFKNYSDNKNDFAKYTANVTDFLTRWEAIDKTVRTYDLSDEYLKKLYDRAGKVNEEIVAFKQLVDATYANEEDFFNAPSKVLGDQAFYIDKELTALQSNIDTAARDVAAYNEFWGEGGTRDQFDVAYRDQMTLVGDIDKDPSGIDQAPDGSPLYDVFGTYKAEVEDYLEGTYKSACNVVDGTTAVEDFAAKADGLIKTLTDAEAAMKDKASGAVEKAMTQRGLYAQGVANYQAKAKELEDLVKTTSVPAEYQDELDARIAAAEAALKALNDYYVYSLKELGLPDPLEDGDKYLNEAFDDAVKEIKNLVDKEKNPVVYLTNQLESLKHWVANETNIASLTGEYAVDVNGKFADTYESIQAAIDAYDQAIKDGKEPAATVDQIDESISTVKTNAQTIIDSFAKAMTGLRSFAGDINTLNNWAAAKIVLPESDKDGVISGFKYQYMTGAGEGCVETNYNSFLAQYKAAAAVEGYKCVEAADKVSSDLTAYNPGAKCAAAEVALTKDISGSNKTYVNYLVDDSKVKADEYAAEYKDLGGLGFDGFADRFKEIYDKVEATLAIANATYDTLDAENVPTESLSTKYEGDWTNLDKQYQTALTQFADVEKALNDLIANMDAYKELLTSCGNLQWSIDYTVSDYISTCPTKESKDYYNGEVDNLRRQLGTLEYKVETSAKGLTAVADKPGLDGEIAALYKAISDLQVEIDANTNAYNKLFDQATGVRKDIDSKIAELKNPNKYSQEAVAENIKALEALRDETMYGYTQEILDLTNKGEISGQLNDYTEKFGQVAADAETEYKMAMSEYNANVANVNADKYQEWKTNELIPAQGIYSDAVNAYKNYEGLTNKGLVDLLNFSENSAEIYKYNALIRQVDENVQAKIKNLNGVRPNARVITDAELQQFSDDLTGYENGITAALKETNDRMNTLSLTYYTTLHADAKAAYDKAKLLLDNAGIATGSTADQKSVFQPVTDALKAAETSYGANNAKGDFTSSYMNTICDNLDMVVKVGTDAGIQNLAQNAWKQVYDAAAASQKTWATDIEGYKQFADPDLYTEQFANFSQAANKLAAANGKATADEILINSYAIYLGELNAALTSMKNAHDLLKENSGSNFESKSLYKEYIGEDGNGGLVGDVQKKFDEVMTMADNLLARDAAAVKAIQSQIDAMKDYVEINSSTLYQRKADLARMLEDLDIAVANGYETVKTSELSILEGTILKDVKDSFNKKKVDSGFTDVDEEKAYETRISDAEKAIAALRGVDVDDAAGIEKFKTDAAALENTLCDLNNELNPTQYPAEALDALNGAYSAVESALNAAEGALAECTQEVQEKYAGVYPTLRAELEAIKAAYEAEGNKVSYLVDFYTPQIDEVNSEIAAERAKVDKSEKNQVAFDGFDTGLQKFETEFAALSQTVENLIAEDDEQKWLEFFLYNRIVAVDEEDVHTEVLPQLADELEKVRQQLQSDYEAENLVVTSNSGNIASQLNNIENSLLSYDMLVLLQYTNVELNEASADITAANDKIEASRRNLVESTYNELKAKAQNLETGYNAEYTVYHEIWKKFSAGEVLSNTIRWENVNSLKGAVAEANAISDAAKALVIETEESKWMLGDVNLNPDGTVNIIDVQMVVNWVGENINYGQLFDENARQAMAADINGDSKLNIADVTGVIGIASRKPDAPRRVIGAPNMQNADGSLSLKLVSDEDGVRRYAIYLTNGVPFVAGQLDIMLAPGMRVVAAENGVRSEGHDFYLFDNVEFARIIVASMENAEFTGDNGIIGYIDVEGEGKVNVDNIIFSDSNTVTYKLGAAGASKVDDIIDNVKNGVERIYNAAGQQFNKLQNGINIIRHKDGRTTKEMKRN